MGISIPANRLINNFFIALGFDTLYSCAMIMRYLINVVLCQIIRSIYFIRTLS